MNPLLTHPLPLFQLGAEPGWEKRPGSSAFHHTHLQVEAALYRTPGRPNHDTPWMVVHRKAAVAIAPRLADGRWVLIAQERLPVQSTLWEFPAGQIDLPLDAITADHIVTTALAELHEEAGLTLHPETGRLRPLGYFFPSQGFTDEHVYLLLAEPVWITRPPAPEDSEHISEIRFVTSEHLRQMIAANEISNALTLSLFARMAALSLI